MKSCGYEKWINRFIDGELSEPDRHEFKRHLASCDNCRKEVSGIEIIKDLFSSVVNGRSFPSDVTSHSANFFGSSVVPSAKVLCLNIFLAFTCSMFLAYHKI